MDDYTLIAHHGLIGDLQTAALVTTEGRSQRDLLVHEHLVEGVDEGQMVG